MNIHKTAIVSPNARLGENVQIGAYAIVEDNTTIGDNTVILPRAYICKNTILGANCKVHMNAVIGNLPQDLSFDPSTPTGAVIGDGSEMREGVTIHRATKEGKNTVLGSNCYLMANAHVAHDCIVGNNVIFANGALLAGHVTVGDRVFLSGNSGAHQFTRIGRFAMISGLSRIISDVPPFMTMELDSLIRGINIVGLKRGGFTPQVISEIKRAYHILYRENLPFTKAYIKIEEMNTPETLEIVEFCRSSKRGICKHVIF